MCALKILLTLGGIFNGEFFQFNYFKAEYESLKKGKVLT